MRGRAFKGTPTSVAPWQPWIAPSPLQEKGIPLGFGLRTGKMIVFHPWSLPTHSTTFQIEGEKDSGKSTFMKTVMPRLLGLQATDAYGNPTLMRGRINSRKSENGIAEFEPLTRALYSPTYDLGAEASINLFGLFRREADIIEVAINIAQEINGGPIGEHVAHAYMVGIRKMLHDMRDIASPSVLEIVLRKLTLEDFKDYHRANNSEVMAQFADELALRPDLRNQLEITDSEIAVGVKDLDGATQAANYLGQLLRGNYGRAFGGNHSLQDVLSQQLVTLDWENMPENARVLLEAVIRKAEASAIVWSQDPANRGSDLTTIVPHINMSDEEGGAMKSLMHVRFTADRQNKSRAYPTADFRAVQYYSQVTQAGDANSELRGLAQEIELGVGCRIIFRQPNDTDFLQRFSRLGLSDPDVAFLPQLGVGQAMFWVRDRPPVYFQHVVTTAEMPLIQSNSRRKKMNEGTPVWDNPTFQDRARRVGISMLGEDYAS